ncbi:MAG: hypothetical protein MRY32_09980 [Rickettsiales bacterium]|nr:hypothetical protein [Rickettsiales bacterium]
MRSVNFIQAIDAAELQMPVQWSFKDRRGNGAHVEVFLRRVINGNEVPLADESDGGYATHLKGKFSDAQTLMERFDDASLVKGESEWMKEITAKILSQMAVTMRHSRHLLELFSRKGKLEIYGPNTLPFRPQYISGNFTLKLHVSAFSADDIENLFTHLIAQHLDYPYAPGERRYSTSRLFDLCFLAEKTIAPKSLAAEIDNKLTARGIYQPHRHKKADLEQIDALCDGLSASINSSYDRVLQRERFASFVTAMVGRSRSAENASILKHYMHLIGIDLITQSDMDFKNHPGKHIDEFAAQMHVPLMMIIKQGEAHG